MYMLGAAGTGIAGAAGMIIAKKLRDCNFVLFTYKPSQKEQSREQIMLDACKKLIRSHKIGRAHV